MNDLFTAALELQHFCVQRHWRFCFIGGLAVQRWGEPRFTGDAGMTLLTGFGGEQPFAETLLEHFAPRQPDALAFALDNRVLLLRAANRIPLDVALGGLPFEANTIRRASAFGLPTGQFLTTCSAEDLVVHKVFAAREKDWLDVDGILARQWGRLNFDLIRGELKPLLELQEKPESLARLEQKIREHNQSTPLQPPGKS